MQNRRVYFSIIAVLWIVAAGVYSADEEGTVKLVCGNVSTPCGARPSSGVMLISGSDTPTKKTTSDTVIFEGINDSFKQAIGFRKNSAPAYEQVTWTEGENILTFKDREELPVRIWVICGPNADGTCPALNPSRRKKLQGVITHGNSTLYRERAGITLVPAGGMLISDETGNAALTALKDSADCASFKAQANTLNKIDAQAVNIYMVQTILTPLGPRSDFGQECSDNSHQVAVVGATTTWSIIVHEIGHMLALDDVTQTAAQWGSDPDENFMRHESDFRKFFTEGQVFRMHLGTTSAVNVLLNEHPTDKRYCESSPPLPCPKPNERIWADH